MRVLAMFCGRNRVFRAWLAAGMPENVVSIEEYKKKRTVHKRPPGKKNNIIPFILPKGTA